MKAYYAHPVTLYGTTQETLDLATIKALGFEVENPNTPEHDEGYKKHGMGYFMPIIRRCNLLIFRALPDGSIPAGINQEINYARGYELPVIELPTGVVRRTLDVVQTREFLKEMGRKL